MFKLPGIIKEYRPELNGLRGLAVLLVLLFHLDFYWMEGGFLGVDIFLVISGYFISKNILYDRQNGKFTFKRFYTKRLRRLFPALIFTLIAVIVAGYFLLTPANYERLGLSTLFSALSVSNFFFWQESGYFDLDAIGKPLLHMWSLSLEEQFYLFWPLLLVTMHRILRKYLLWFIFGFIVVSIGLAEWYFNTDPSATFFLIPFRMFEFLLGASCIWLEQLVRREWNSLREVLFLLGFSAMIFSGVVFDGFSRMPGLLSLIPCGGAMLTIIGGKARISSWLLKNKPTELIGKASYSIYLAHWPLIVYYKYWSLSELTLKVQLVLGLISITLGFLMYFFIENTFRFPKKKYRRLDPVWYVIPSLVVILCLGSAFISSKGGLADRFDNVLFMSKEELLANRENYFENYRENDAFLNGDNSQGHILTLGNSHSIDLIYALRQNGYEGRITSLQSLGKCFNFGESFNEPDKDWCTNQKVKNLANPNWKSVDAVYLHDNWPKLDMDGFRNMINTVRQNTEAPIFVFGPKMTFTSDVPDIVSNSRTTNTKNVNRHADGFQQKVKYRINTALNEEFENGDYNGSGVYFIDMLEAQAEGPDGRYDVMSNDTSEFLYFDRSHFTELGSKRFGSRLKGMHPYLFNMALLRNKFHGD